MNTFVKTVTQNRVNYEFIKSLNGIMNLTQREMDILKTIMDIHAEGIRFKPRKIYVDNADTRKRIMSETGVTKDNLSRYMSVYKTKGILIRDGNNFIINKALLPNIIGGTTVQITLVLKIKENEETKH